MAARGMYETVKQAIQDVVAPDLERIKGELAGLRAEMRALDDRLGSVRNEMHAGFRALDDRIDALKERVADTNRIRATM